MGTQVEDISDEETEDAVLDGEEEYVPESKAALYWSRGLYIVSGLCFVVALVVLINSATLVNDTLPTVANTTPATLGDTLVASAHIIRTILDTFLWWLIAVTVGLLSWVTGVCVKTFVR